MSVRYFSRSSAFTLHSVNTDPALSLYSLEIHEKWEWNCLLRTEAWRFALFVFNDVKRFPVLFALTSFKHVLFLLMMFCLLQQVKLKVNNVSKSMFKCKTIANWTNRYMLMCASQSRRAIKIEHLWAKYYNRRLAFRPKNKHGNSFVDCSFFGRNGIDKLFSFYVNLLIFCISKALRDWIALVMSSVPLRFVHWLQNCTKKNQQEIPATMSGRRDKTNSYGKIALANEKIIII